MSIIRGPRPSDNYAQIHNAALSDGRLSFKARGILAYLLSRPPGWQTSVERLAKQGLDGERAIKSGLKELEAFGYLKRLKLHNEDGTYTYHQEITDQPSEPIPPTDTELIEDGTTGAKRTGGKRTGAKPPSISNTDTNNNETTGVVVNSPTVTRTPQADRHGWWPTDAAIATATQLHPITDIDLSVTRYRIVKAERKAQPDSAEWLRWFIEDEKKARAEERKDMESRHRAKPWYEVAQ